MVNDEKVVHDQYLESNYLKNRYNPVLSHGHDLKRVILNEKFSSVLVVMLQ